MFGYIKILFQEWYKLKTFPNPLNIFKTLGKDCEEKHISNLIAYAFLSGHFSYYLMLVKQYTYIFNIQISDLHKSTKDTFFFSVIFSMLFLTSLMFFIIIYKIFPIISLALLSLTVLLWLLILLSINYVFMVGPLNNIMKAHFKKNTYAKAMALSKLNSITHTKMQEKANFYKMNICKRIFYMFSAFPNDVYEYFKMSNNPYKFILLNWSVYNLRILKKAKKMFMTDFDNYVLSEKKKFKKSIEKNLLLLGWIICILATNLIMFLNNTYMAVAIIVLLIVFPMLIILWLYIKNIINAKNSYVNELFKKDPDLKGQFYTLFEKDKITSSLVVIDNNEVEYKKKRRL